MGESHSELMWEFDRTTTPWLRRFSYLVFGAFGGLLVLGLLVRVRYLQQGKYLQFLVLVAALVVGPITVLGGLQHVRGGTESTTSTTEESESNFRWSLVVIVAVVEGVVASVATSIGGVVASMGVAILFTFAFGGVLALNVLSTEGAIDPESETLRVTDPKSTIDLTSVRGVRTVRAGPVAFAWMQYPPGDYSFGNLDTRRLVTVSPEVANRLETMYERERRK